MNIRFQARAGGTARVAVAGSAVQREIPRENVDQAAVLFEANTRGAFDGIGHVVGSNLMRPAEFVYAARVGAFDAAAANADDHPLDGYLGFGFGLLDGGLNARAERLGVGDAALV